MEKNNHQDWLNKGPWYNTSIYLRLQGSLFEDFITHSISDRYNIICSVVSHDKIKPAYEDDENSIGDRSIPKNATVENLKALGDTIKNIDIWLKLFEERYFTRCVAYINAMKDMFKEISLTMIK